MLHFKKTYVMNKKEANDTLQNIFDACNMSYNTVPFDKLMLRSMAETKLVKVFKYIGIFFLVLSILSPLAFKRDQNFMISGTKPGQPIVVVDHQLYGGYFAMTLYGSKIDWENIHCVDDTGAILYPSSIDKETGVVVIPYDCDSFNIYIPNTDGYVLQGVVSKPK